MGRTSAAKRSPPSSPPLSPPRSPEPGNPSAASMVSDFTRSKRQRTDSQNFYALGARETTTRSGMLAEPTRRTKSTQGATQTATSEQRGANIPEVDNLGPNPFHISLPRDTGTIEQKSDGQTSVSAMMQMRQRPLPEDGAQVLREAQVAEASLSQLVKMNRLGTITNDTLSGDELNLRVEWIDMAFASAFYSSQVVRYFADPDRREKYLEQAPKKTGHLLTEQIEAAKQSSLLFIGAANVLIVRITAFLLEVNMCKLAAIMAPEDCRNVFVKYMNEQNEKIDEELFAVMSPEQFHELKEKCHAAKALNIARNLEDESITQQFGDEHKTKYLIKPAAFLPEAERFQEIIKQWYDSLMEVIAELLTDPIGFFPQTSET